MFITVCGEIWNSVIANVLCLSYDHIRLHDRHSFQIKEFTYATLLLWRQAEILPFPRVRCLYYYIALSLEWRLVCYKRRYTDIYPSTTESFYSALLDD